MIKNCCCVGIAVRGSFSQTVAPSRNASNLYPFVLSRVFPSCHNGLHRYHSKFRPGSSILALDHIHPPTVHRTMPRFKGSDRTTPPNRGSPAFRLKVHLIWDFDRGGVTSEAYHGHMYMSVIYI
jgi:hypothetical protein